MFSLPTSSPDPLGLTSSKATLGVPGLPFQRLLCSWSSFSCPFPRVSIPGGTLQHLRRVHSSLLCHSGWHLYLCALWTHLDTSPPSTNTPPAPQIPWKPAVPPTQAALSYFSCLLLAQGAFQAARSWISISRQCQTEVSFPQQALGQTLGIFVYGYICRKTGRVCSETLL